MDNVEQGPVIRSLLGLNWFPNMVANQSNIVSTTVSLKQAQSYLEKLDLKYIIDVMCSESYSLPRWTIKDSTHCSLLYKNFIFLQKKYLHKILVPTREIDEFWHNHILHTQKYFRDCMNIFGHYLHHKPALPNENIQQLVDDYVKTKQLYLAEFKHPMDTIDR